MRNLVLMLVAGLVLGTANAGLGAPSGAPGPGGPGVVSRPVAVPAKVSAPTNFQYTNSPQVCKAHVPGLGAALVCPGLIAAASTLPLVWDWAPCQSAGCVSKPDGFRIYRVTLGHSSGSMLSLGTKQLVDTQNDPTITIRGISPYVKTDCFVATAFKGSVESADSNSWCGSRDLAMGTSRVVIPVLQTFTGYKWIEQVTENCSLSYLPHPPDGAEGLVSFDDGTCSGDFIYHAYFGFDLSPYIRPSASLAKVVFQAESIQDQYGSGHGVSTSFPCAITGVALALPSTWWIPAFTNAPQVHPQEVDSSTEVDVSADGRAVSADITHWFASGNRAFGMGFSHKPDPTLSTDGCWSRFKNAMLYVTYYPSSS